MTIPAVSLKNLGKCILCGASSRRKLFEIPNSVVYECHACRLRYIDPCLSPEAMKSAYESDDSLTQYHDFHEGYYDYGDLETESKTLKDFRRGLECLEKNFASSQNRKILDVGFGNGLFLALAQQRGWQVQGIDSSPRNIELARNKFKLELTHAGWEDYVADEGSFEAISFWDVIEHLPDPHAAIVKAKSLLAQNGLILAAVPHDTSLLRYLSTAIFRLTGGHAEKGIEKIYLLEHVAYYRLATLQELFRRNQFLLKDHFYTHTDLNKYSLPWYEKWIARMILAAGRITGLENRLVAIFKKQAKQIDI